MKILKTMTIILVILLILIFFRGCAAYNKIVKLDETVSHQWGMVENAYQRRADLIPSLVAAIKGSSNFEQNTLTGVIEARAKATSVNIDVSHLTERNIRNFQAIQGQLSAALSRLLVTIERYPDLKTTQQFQDMLVSLEGTENQINSARNEYNETVKAYNSYIRRFPQIVFAKMFSFDIRGYFKSEAGAERRVDIDLSNNTSDAAPAEGQNTAPSTAPESEEPDATIPVEIE